MLNFRCQIKTKKKKERKKEREKERKEERKKKTLFVNVILDQVKS